MLIRRDGDTVLCVGQPAHAWVSGQLARAWGNSRFGAVEPWEEVCLGAEQHDVGMARWEAEPTRNPHTGLPHSFLELPLEHHMEMWSAAARLVLPQSRYAALLVSMHGSALYERRDLARMAPQDAARVRAFLGDQRALQRELAAGLGADQAGLRRNQRLVWTWDALSLGLLLGWAPYDAQAVPTAGDPVTVALRASGGTHSLDPWPFRAREVRLRCEGRRLPAAGAPDEAGLRRLLAGAPWETIELRLVAPG